MPTFQEVMKLAKITVNDKTSGKRMREIERILHDHHAFSGLTPEKATAILEDLGPTFVKMGQIASNRSDIIPKEYADAFKTLRAHVSPLPFSVIVEAIDGSLGHPWQETFSSIEQQPLGSASIAQVHRARLAKPASGNAVGEGELVAIKVRRPRVAEQMAEDLTLIRHVLALADVTHMGEGVRLSLDDLVDELEKTTSEELDFRIETDNLERFREEQADQPGVTCPHVYPAFSSDDMLVMEYVKGPHIIEQDKLRSSGDDPAELGQRLAENYVTQVVDRGFFHADPHPGNILVRDHEIVWIDLGMTGSLNASERAMVGKMLVSVAQNDPYALKDTLLTLAKPRGPVDHGKLLEQVSVLLASYASVDLAYINVGMALLDVIEVLRSQNLTLPSSMTMLARGMVTLEGVLVEIAPTTSVVGIISDHVKTAVFNPSSIEAKAKELINTSAASAEALTRLPSQVSHTLDMVDRGQIKVGADLTVSRDLIAALYSVSGTVALALISAGLFVGSSLIAQTNMEPKILEVPLIGILGYVGAFVLSVYVVWRTLSVRHERRNNEKLK